MSLSRWAALRFWRLRVFEGFKLKCLWFCQGQKPGMVERCVGGGGSGRRSRFSCRLPCEGDLLPGKPYRVYDCNSEAPGHPNGNCTDQLTPFLSPGKSCYAQDGEAHGIPAQDTPPFLFYNKTPLCKIYFHWSWNFILQIWSQEHGSHWQVPRTLIQWDKLTQES